MSVFTIMTYQILLIGFFKMNFLEAGTLHYFMGYELLGAQQELNSLRAICVLESCLSTEACRIFCVSHLYKFIWGRQLKERRWGSYWCKWVILYFREPAQNSVGNFSAFNIIFSRWLVPALEDREFLSLTCKIKSSQGICIKLYKEKRTIRSV